MKPLKVAICYSTSALYHVYWLVHCTMRKILESQIEKQFLFYHDDDGDGYDDCLDHIAPQSPDCEPTSVVLVG